MLYSLKSNSTKSWVTFHDSCEKTGSSKTPVDIFSAVSHWGLSTLYNKHNLFHQSKRHRGVELQNTLIVLHKSYCDVMRITTLNTQLGLGKELAD